MEEPFVFNNVKEKAVSVVKISKNCEDLSYNLDEYNNTIQKYALGKNFQITFSYTIKQPCDDNVLNTSFNLILVSLKMSASSSFSARK
jgi:hypothetical protein